MDKIERLNGEGSKSSNSREIGWFDAAKAFLEKKVFILVLLGFSAGLPYLLVFSTLTAWLHEGNVSLSTIGFFSWVGITYSIKVFWSPIVDRVALPGLFQIFGQRRSWMLIAQIGIAAGLIGMSVVGNDLSDPSLSKITLTFLATFALLVAFSSATQDIAIDAYRIEIADSQKQGVMSAAYIFGYRVAILVSGAGAFYLADFFNWTIAYLVMASLVSVGVIAVLIAPEVRRKGRDSIDESLPEIRWITKKVQGKPNWQQRFFRWLVFAVVSPFTDFVNRHGTWAIYLFLIIALYKISDIVMGVMATTFYLDIGFTLSEIASVSKIFGFFLTMFGSAFGGIVVVKFGILKPLLYGACLVAGTNLLFAFLATLNDPSLMSLAIVIGADNFSGGLANVVFIAFLSSLTSRSFTATQYALFSSLMTLPGKILGGYSGVLVDLNGYEWFFIYSSFVGIPSFLIIFWLLKKRPDLNNPNNHQASHKRSD